MWHFTFTVMTIWEQNWNQRDNAKSKVFICLVRPLESKPSSMIPGTTYSLLNKISDHFWVQSQEQLFHRFSKIQHSSLFYTRYVGRGVVIQRVVIPVLQGYEEIRSLTHGGIIKCQSFLGKVSQKMVTVPQTIKLQGHHLGARVIVQQ